MIIKKPETESVNIGALSLDIQIERTKRKKTISLQIKDNKLIIKAPKLVSRKSLDELIQRKKNWIRQREIGSLLITKNFTLEAKLTNCL